MLFVKFPEKGKVKTRLAKKVGDDHAVDLYRCFILDMLTMLDSSGIQVCVCYAPEAAGRSFRAWLGNDYAYFLQQGDDLGQRMSNSFQQAFQYGFGKVVVIGSDLPDLSAHVIVAAFEKLQAVDMVIAPSGDGGYYLLGFRNDTFFPEVFQDITWSTAQVCAETLKKVETAGRTISLLPEWNDIDNYVELQRCYHRNQYHPERAMHTISYWRTMKNGQV